jgi:hypothetical protein
MLPGLLSLHSLFLLGIFLIVTVTGLHESPSSLMLVINEPFNQRSEGNWLFLFLFFLLNGYVTM